jgi:heparin binding hemagglutinin HbhA
MPTGTEVKKYGETVLEQGKAALGEARKPLLAAVGATNLAIDQLRTQLKDLPTETQEQLKRLQDRLQDRAATLDRTRVRKAVEDYAEQARETYATLAKRGERVVRHLRRDPRIRNAFAETEELVERAEATVTDRPASRPAARPATRPAAAKAPARKTTARKTTPKA